MLNMIFKYSIISQYLQDLYSSVNQYFPNKQIMMLQNHIGKRSKVQDRPLAFNAVEKFIGFSFYIAINT